MALVIYIARVTSQTSGYIASFPDFPAVCVQRDTIPQLLQASREQLLLALKAAEAQEGEWPTPTAIDKLKGAAPGEVLLAVDVDVDDPPVRINISIGEHLLKRVDAAAQQDSMSRSGFIAAALGERLHRGAFRPTDDMAQRVYQELLTVGRRVHETIGPESPVGRTLADLDNRAADGLRRIAESLGAALQPSPREPNPFTEAAETEAHFGNPPHPDRRDDTPPAAGATRGDRS